SGEPATLTCADAAEQLGRSVRVYLDGGTAPGGVASTIVDATGEQLRIVREGALTANELGSIAPELLPVHVPETIEDGETEDEAAGDPETEEEAPQDEATGETTSSDAVDEETGAEQTDETPGDHLP